MYLIDSPFQYYNGLILLRFLPSSVWNTYYFQEILSLSSFFEGFSKQSKQEKERSWIRSWVLLKMVPHREPFKVVLAIDDYDSSFDAFSYDSASRVYFAVSWAASGFSSMLSSFILFSNLEVLSALSSFSSSLTSMTCSFVCSYSAEVSSSLNENRKAQQPIFPSAFPKASSSLPISTFDNIFISAIDSNSSYSSSKMYSIVPKVGVSGQLSFSSSLTSSFCEASSMLLQFLVYSSIDYIKPLQNHQSWTSLSSKSVASGLLWKIILSNSRLSPFCLKSSSISPKSTRFNAYKKILDFSYLERRSVFRLSLSIAGSS